MKKGWEKRDCSRKEGSGRNDKCIQVLEDIQQETQTETQEAPSEHQEIVFDCVGDQPLAQVVQGGCGVSILGDIQKPSGHGPEQAALGGPAWAGGLDQSNLSYSMILWFY